MKRRMVDQLKVSLGSRSYLLHFGEDLASDVRAQVDTLVRAGRKVAALTDRNLAQAQGPALKRMLGEVPLLTVEPGEETKSLRGLGQVLDFLAEQRLDRGGVLGQALRSDLRLGSVQAAGSAWTDEARLPVVVAHRSSIGAYVGHGHFAGSATEHGRRLVRESPEPW